MQAVKSLIQIKVLDLQLTQCGGLKPQYKNMFKIMSLVKMGTTTAQKNFFQFKKLKIK